MNLALISKYFVRLLTSKFKTDTISFKVTSDLDYSEDPEGWEREYTDILINDRSLFDRLEEYEEQQAKITNTDRKLAGKYVGVDPQSFERLNKVNNNQEIGIWQCSVCKSALCSSDLVCKFRKDPLFVYLYDFRQVPFNRHDAGHSEMREKTKWNYEYFGPFKFNRQEFFKAVNSL